MLGHEKFQAYQHSIKFVSIKLVSMVSAITDSLPRGNAHLIDQLSRAAISIPLNIAEGSGKTSEKEKIRFYSIARGSTMECAAILDVLSCSRLIKEEQVEESKELLGAVAGILSKICLGK